MLRTLAPGQWLFIRGAAPWPFVLRTNGVLWTQQGSPASLVNHVLFIECVSITWCHLLWLLLDAFLCMARSCHEHCLCGDNHCCTLTCAGGTALSLLRCRKHINPLGFVEVVYLFCLNFKVHLTKCLYFSTLTISSNELNEMVHDFHCCGDMVT